MASNVLITPASSKIEFTDGSNSTKKLNISGVEFNLDSSLAITSSTASATVLKVNGTNGNLLSVIDDLSDSLLSVNNSAGLPVFEVFTDDRIIAGQYGQNDLVIKNNKVGIGNGNPTYKLDVNGNFAAAGTSVIGTTYPQLTLNGTTNQHAYLLINRTSNEGGVQFQTSGSTKWWAYMASGDDTKLRFYASGADRMTIQNDGAVIASSSFRAPIFYDSNDTNYYLDPANTGTSLLVAGNVGIGATSFAYSTANRGLLEIYGSDSLIALKNANGNSYIQKNGDNFYLHNTNAGFISFSTNNAEVWRITSTGILQSNGAQTIQTSTGNLTIATAAGNGHIILSNHGTGNVGIGTATPTQKLEVAGYSMAGEGSYRASIYGSNGGAYLYFGTTNSVGSLGVIGAYGALFNVNSLNGPISFQINGSEKARVHSNGNVGIGTTVPLGLLHLHGDTTNWNTSPTIVMSSSSLNNANIRNWRIGPADSDYGNFHIGVSDIRGGLVDSDSEASTFTITYVGNVGLGFKTVNNKLSVGGSASVGSSYNVAAPTNGLIVEGGVGIGVTSPAAKLQVNGQTFINNIGSGATNELTLNANGVNYCHFYDLGSGFNHIALGGSANLATIPTTPIMVWGLTNGNVGIGMTSPSSKLHINSTTSGATLLRADGTNGTLFSIVDDLSDSLMSVNNSAGLPVFEVFADDRIIAGQYGQNDLVIKNNKVGIGILNPSQKLEVNGAIRGGSFTIATTNTGEAWFGRGSDRALGSYTLQFGGSSTTNTWFELIDRAWSKVIFAVSGAAPSDSFKIDSSGNAGIGTPSPAAKIDSSPADGGAAYAVRNWPMIRNEPGANGLDFGGYTASQWNKLRFYSNGSLALTINSSGNVGINQTNPSVKLHVSGSSIISDTTVIDPDSYTNTVVAGGIADGGGWGLGSAIGGNAGVGNSWAIGHSGSALYMGMGNGSANDTLYTYIQFDQNRNLYLAPNAATNVGIGTVTPGSRLDVNGVIRGDAGANYPHSFTNNDGGNTHWTNRNNRLLTSNGANWAADGKDPIIALVTSGNSNATTIANTIGLTLHNESNENNTYSPAIAFSNRSNSGNYNATYALIIGKKTGQGVDANWSAGELHFYTMPAGAYVGSNPNLMIASNGYVGIGTSTPSVLLQVGTGGPTAATSGIQFGDDAGSRLYRAGSGYVQSSGGFQANGWIYASSYIQAGNNQFYPSSYGATSALRCGNAATNDWITGISIAPGGNVTVAGTLTESSSIRYKENIETINKNILPKLCEIRPVTYNKKDNKNTREYGIIAEELYELFPELINKNDNQEVESVNYSRLTVLLIKAVKELKDEVEKLKNK